MQPGGKTGDLETDAAQRRLAALVAAVGQQLAPLGVAALREHEVVHAAGEGVVLQVLGEEPTEDAEELARRLGTVDLEDRVDETVRRRSELGLVEDAS